MHLRAIMAILSFTLCACAGDDGDGEGNSSAESSNASNSDASNSDASASMSGGGAESCANVCAVIAADPMCAAGGVTLEVCEANCTTDECAACFESSTVCGGDCMATCTGGGSSEDDSGPDSMTSPGSMTEPESMTASDTNTTDPGPTACTTAADCVESGEICAACGFNDLQGTCAPEQGCTFSTDCAPGAVCGYLMVDGIATTEGRCTLPEAC
jgi:hypothetical protein